MAKGRVSRPLMYTGSIWTFLINLQCRGFTVEFFTVLLISQNLARLSSVLSLISYLLVIVLRLGPFENNLFELAFTIFRKTCFYGQTLSGSRG